jgi:phosphoribosylformylglycinamidine cyclo-ligase
MRTPPGSRAAVSRRIRPLTYRAAGVDRAARDAILADVRAEIRSTFRDGVMDAGEGFGGLFRLLAASGAPLGSGNGAAPAGGASRDPVLVCSIDGVGTKTRIAALCGRLHVAGADIVSHGANDVLCHGATPLFMVDYIAAASLDLPQVTAVIGGITDACRRQGIALLGGETAEMPGVYTRGEIDVVGCTVGVVDRADVITGETIRPGDAVIGVASDGLHTNGYTLARAALLPSGGPGAVRRALARRPGGLGDSLGEALLRPHRPYARVVLALRASVEIHGIAHVTGGGVPGNLVRIIPEGCRAVLQRGRWPVPSLFTLIQTRGRITAAEMFRTFNMGLGLLLVVPPSRAPDAVARLTRAGEQAWVVGDIASGPRAVEIG